MNAKRMRTKDQIDKLPAEEIYDKYLVRQNQFNNEYRFHERARATSHALLTEAGVMMHFLVDLNSEELAKAEAEAARPLPMAEGQLEQRDELEHAEDVAAAQAALRLR